MQVFKFLAQSSDYSRNSIIQHHDNMGTEKGRVSRQADRKGRSARSRTGGGARARRGARRNRSGNPEDPEEPQVELEGEC